MKKSNSNILHVVNIYFVLPFFIGNQFIYFKEKGYNLKVVCSQSPFLKDYSKNQGFEYLETPINRDFSFLEDLKSISRICRYIRKNNIGIIEGHTPKGGLIAMVAGRLCGVPKRLYFRHGLVYETSKGFKRFILKTIDRFTSICATKVVCVSQSVLERSIEDRLASKNKQVVLGNGTCNGIDTEVQFNPQSVLKERIKGLRIKYNIDEKDFVIGYSGRLVRDKGIIELIEAFDLIKNKENCRLLLVGMFEERDALPEKIKNRILTDPAIIYTGFINNGMENYYSLMNVYVLPSYREGFPTGVLEAQSMKLPVITTRVTGCCDSILEGVTGLFSTHEPEDIASKIEKIRDDKIIDGDKGREWVYENFRNELVWKEIEKLYEE